MNIEKEADSCYDALMKVLAYADLRKQLADDEHRDPLPIYGSARWYYRRPLVQQRNLNASKEPWFVRLLMTRTEYEWPAPGINNEEGC